MRDQDIGELLEQRASASGSRHPRDSASIIGMEKAPIARPRAADGRYRPAASTLVDKVGFGREAQIATKVVAGWSLMRLKLPHTSPAPPVTWRRQPRSRALLQRAASRRGLAQHRSGRIARRFPCKFEQQQTAVRSRGPAGHRPDMTSAGLSDGRAASTIDLATRFGTTPIAGAGGAGAIVRDIGRIVG